jgi:hypothetical protein
MKHIPLEVVKAAFELTAEQVTAAFNDAYNLTEVKCIGMMPSGAFAYEVKGKWLPSWLTTLHVRIHLCKILNDPRLEFHGFYIYGD